MAQALVQLSAPAPIRGRVIGVFSMAASGMRTFSGFTVGRADTDARRKPVVSGLTPSYPSGATSGSMTAVG
jgi:hypothetical protein